MKHGPPIIPPRAYTTLLEWALPSGIRRESILGDLCEEFLNAVESGSRSEARRWYKRQVLRIVIQHLFHRRLNGWQQNAISRHQPRHGPSRGDPFLSTILADLRFAVRSFIRTPGFTTVAILTIALGVGANSAIFSVVHSVLLRPLPYPESNRIVRPWAEKIFSRPMFLEFRDQTNSFSHLALSRGASLTVTEGDEPEVIGSGTVTAEYFGALGVSPFMGRTFLPEDQEPGAEPVVLLTHGFWERRYGADPEIIGQTIGLDGQGVRSRTVIGVMPKTFRQYTGGQVWIPISMDPDDPNTNFLQYGYRLIARLAPGVTIEQSQADVSRLVATFPENHPTQFRPIRRSPISVLSLHQSIVGDVKATLWLLLGAVGLVLLIACSNVANLLLARSGAREKEVAIRLALGADRKRVIRQLLTESTLLGFAGGATGVVAAVATMAMLVRRLPSQVPRTSDISIDAFVLAFAAGVSLLAGLVFGLAPAIRATRASPGMSLTDASRGTSFGRSRHQLNNVLVVAEVSLAMVLVIGAGLMLKSFTQLKHVDVGFHAERLVSLRPLPPRTRYADQEQRGQYYESVLERLRAVPGVDGATTVNMLPMTNNNSGVPYLVEGQDIPDGSVSQVVNFRTVTADYFETMGIPMLQGRSFTDADRQDAPTVGIANETLVKLHWPDEDPIGKRILDSSGDLFATVIGVVQSIQQHQLDLAPKPQIYLPVTQAGYRSPFVIVNTSRDPNAILANVREAVRSVDATVPIIQVRTMNEVIDESLGSTRAYTSLFSAFAVLSLLLGAVGVYGVLSYTTSQRTREIGVRIALGASPKDVIRGTLRKGVAPVLTGIGIGTAMALGLTRLLTSLLFEVTTSDPIIFGGVAIVLAAMGFAASYIPALRAARVDPMVVLNDG